MAGSSSAAGLLALLCAVVAVRSASATAAARVDLSAWSGASVSIISHSCHRPHAGDDTAIGAAADTHRQLAVTRRAVDAILVPEAAARTAHTWKTTVAEQALCTQVHDLPTTPTIEVHLATGASAGDVATLLASLGFPGDDDATQSAAAAVAAHDEGYALWSFASKGTRTSTSRSTSNSSGVALVAVSGRAAVMGVGRLLREIEWGHRGAGGAWVRPNLRVLHAPPSWFHVRGHQFTDWAFWFTPWPAAAQQYIRDLVVFGTNQIEFAHINWARGDLAKLVTYSSYLDSLDLNVSVWYPLNMYTGAGGVQATEAMLQGMTRLNSVFVPGGDGGEVLAPEGMLDAMRNMSTLVHKYHPDAQMWLSAQEYSSANLTAFMKAIAAPDVPTFLAGIVYGPHVHVPLTQFLDMLPGDTQPQYRYPVRQYPDLCHNIEAQFEVPLYDPAFQFTHRRQAINPSPVRMRDIVSLRTNATYTAHDALIGFGAYSEGTNDDLNKVVWSAYASDSSLGVTDIVDQYASYFFGSDAGFTPTTTAEGGTISSVAPSSLATLMSSVLFGLERNWAGPLGTTLGQQRIAATLSTLHAAQAAASSQALADNWRLQMYLFRGYYDAVVAARLRFDLGTEGAAREALARSAAVGSSAALAAAATVLAQGNTDPTLSALYADMYGMASRLNSTLTWRVVQSQQQNMALGTVNQTISDVGYLGQQVAAIQAMPSTGSGAEAARQAAIAALLSEGQTMAAGGFYDRLGSVDAADHPHLVAGAGVLSDPSFYFTPLQGVEDAPSSGVFPPTRQAWRTFTLAFFDAATVLRYAGLRSDVGYNVTVVYFRDDRLGADVRSSTPSTRRMVANGNVVVHNYTAAPLPMSPLTFTLPRDVTASGSLELSWNQPPGLEGSGRCNWLSEVYVTPLV